MMLPSNRLKNEELRAGIALAAVIFLRMLGIFMLIPVAALMTHSLPGATPLNIGIVLGIYGLTQTLFQIPMGLLSDKWGRKIVIVLGLCVFILGSLIAAYADSVEYIIVGRAIQGCGAIAASVMALAADLSRDTQRTKLMAIIGGGFALAFATAFIVGPNLYSIAGYRGIFLVGTGLAILAIVVLFILVPTPQTTTQKQAPSVTEFKKIILNKDLFPLSLYIFFSHLVMMANFSVLPLILRDSIGITIPNHWQFYCFTIFLSLGWVVPMILLEARKTNQKKTLLLLAVGLVTISQIGMLSLQPSLLALIFFTMLLFAGFNYMEAFLPAQISRTVTPLSRGTALGFYSSCQFIGIFIGGTLGGLLHHNFGLYSVYQGCIMLCLIWTIILFRLPKI